MPRVTTADEALTELLLAETAEHGSVRPPWIRLPGVHPFDIAWRMGAGETHLLLWSAWAPDHDVSARLAVLRGYGAIPVDWASWAAEAVEVIAGDDSDEIPFEEIRRRLNEVGLTVAGEPDEG